MCDDKKGKQRMNFSLLPVKGNRHRDGGDQVLSLDIGSILFPNSLDLSEPKSFLKPFQ